MEGIKSLVTYIESQSNNLSYLDISLNKSLGVYYDTCLHVSSLITKSSLQAINLSSTNFMSMMRCSFYDALRQSPHLQVLDISSNTSILSEGAIYVFCAFMSESNLRFLNISYCSMGNHCMCVLGTILENNPRMKLEVLLMKGNGIDEKGMGMLCKGLCKNKSLRVLDVRENSMVFSAFSDIADMLVENNTLRHFLVSHFRDARLPLIEKLGKALQVNKTLNKLSLNNCSIDDAMCVALFQSLCQNESLRELDLASNMISQRGAISIGRYLNFNSSLYLVGFIVQSHHQKEWIFHFDAAEK